jgi:PAS domain S-box-containing protein
LNGKKSGDLILETLKVVIIEDEEAHFSLMMRAIVREFSSASVVHFQDATTCLERLDQINPTVIITDYLMPGMNGVEFLEVLNQENIDTPVIMITGQGDENIAVQAIKSGAKDYLVKTGDFFTLLPSVIDNVIRNQRLKQSLEESESQKQAILDVSLDQIRYVDADLKIIWANKKVVSDLNVSLEDVIGQFCYKILRGREAACVGCPCLKARETGHMEKCTLYYPELEGKYFDSYSVPIIGEKVKIKGFIQSSRDITEQKKIEKALKQSEKRFRDIVDNAPFGYYRIGKDGLWQYVNKEWERMHGYSGMEIIGKHFELIQPEENRAQFRENVQRGLSGETFKGEFGQRLKNGSYGYHEYNIQPVYQSGEIVGIEGFINDTTERRQAEDLVRNLSHMLIQAQEHERKKLSYELHDSIAQNLSSLKIGCDMLLKDQSVISPELTKKAAKLSRLSEQINIDVRNLAYDLQPPGLEELGLVKTLEMYCEDFSENRGVKVDFHSAGMGMLNLDFHTSIHLYRLVQEGLSNISKHAATDRAKIMLLGASPNIILRIEDDGKGFDITTQEVSLGYKKGIGLQSMKERINLLGGQITIKSGTMQGTKILIIIPFKRQTSE